MAAWFHEPEELRKLDMLVAKRKRDNMRKHRRRGSVEHFFAFFAYSTVLCFCAVSVNGVFVFFETRIFLACYRSGLYPLTRARRREGSSQGSAT